jgi:hypothetical protein
MGSPPIVADLASIPCAGGSTVGLKRALTQSSSDEDGDEKKGESDGSTMEEAAEAPTPCPPVGGKTKKEKLKEKKRRRKERRKAASEDQWMGEELSLHSHDDDDPFCYDKYSELGLPGPSFQYDC